MAIGLILFWLALLFLEGGGDGVEAQEYARLKGEANALETISIQKGCQIAEPQVAPKPEAALPRT